MSWFWHELPTQEKHTVVRHQREGEVHMHASLHFVVHFVQLCKNIILLSYLGQQHVFAYFTFSILQLSALIFLADHQMATGILVMPQVSTEQIRTRKLVLSYIYWRCDQNSEMLNLLEEWIPGIPENHILRARWYNNPGTYEEEVAAGFAAAVFVDGRESLERREELMRPTKPSQFVNCWE